MMDRMIKSKFVLGMGFVVCLVWGCSNFALSTDKKADASKVSAEVVSFEQDYTLPYEYLTESRKIESSAVLKISSLRDLYRVGALTASAYESQVTAVNVQKTADLLALKNKYLVNDIYDITSIKYKISNLNSEEVSATVVLKILCTDGSIYQANPSYITIYGSSFLTDTCNVLTAGKCVKSISIVKVLVK